MPALDLFWYDGGMKPRLPEELEAQDVEMSKEGILFIGDQGIIMAGFNGQNPQLFAKGKREPFWKETTSAQDTGGRRRGRGQRYNRWLQAVQGGEQPPGNFTSAGPITDAVNLGTVALRAGKKVRFDSEAMRVTNDADANKYLYREYRKGWEL
jgi:hypothetical protein